MKVENAAAFSFILQDDIYLLEKERLQYSEPQVAIPEAMTSQPAVVAVLQEPEPEIVKQTEPEVVKQPEAISFKYLGGHKKHFLIIVHYPQHEFMDDRHLAALENTIGRLGFMRDDVAIFNLAAHAAASFDAVTGYFKPGKLLMLGARSLPAGIAAIELNKQQTINNFPALYTFGFDEMMDNVERKKAFWEQMKQL